MYGSIMLAMLCWVRKGKSMVEGQGNGHKDRVEDANGSQIKKCPTASVNSCRLEIEGVESLFKAFTRSLLCYQDLCESMTVCEIPASLQEWHFEHLWFALSL